jgi:hemolysin activation/secretion protein
MKPGATIPAAAVFFCFLPGPVIAQQDGEPTLYIREFRVQRARQLPRIAVEDAVYPYLGPGRTAEDVEQARAALEKAYRDKGYQTVIVEVPQQSGRSGLIYLQVTEGTVGRLRVNGARYFEPNEIRRKAPSMAEGRVPNFNDITRDIIALNQWPDRQVTPEIKTGSEPGSVDIDLNVKDRRPLHGSLEINNRYSPGTTHLRVNGGINYNNLWQAGHAVGLWRTRCGGPSSGARQRLQRP